MAPKISLRSYEITDRIKAEKQFQAEQLCPDCGTLWEHYKYDHGGGDVRWHTTCPNEDCPSKIDDW